MTPFLCRKGSGGNLPQSGSGGHLPKTGSGASFGQTGGRQRTFSTGSRVSYVSYSARRPSLSLSHSDAIPYYMEKPTKEEGINVDEGKSDLQKRTYEFMSFSAVYVFSVTAKRWDGDN